MTNLLQLLLCKVLERRQVGSLQRLRDADGGVGHVIKTRHHLHALVAGAQDLSRHRALDHAVQLTCGRASECGTATSAGALTSYHHFIYFL